MMTCTQCRELMPLAYYDELDPSERTEFSKHIETCGSCKAEFGRMKQTLETMRERKQPEPGPGFLEGLWKNLEPEQQTIKRRPPIVRFRPAAVPSWAYGIAAMLLIAVGIYLGRMVIPPSAPEQAVTPPTMAQADTSAGTDLDRSVASYLDRSKVVLLDVVNSAAGEMSPEQFERRQRVSRDLVDRGDILAASLKKQDQEQLRRLIRDLQIVLRQLANTSAESGVPLIEIVRQGVDRKSILLKINIEQMEALSARSARQPARDTLHSKI